MADDIDRPTWQQFESVLQQRAEIARLQRELADLRANNAALLEAVRDQTYTIHQLRAAVEPFADNLREMLGRLQEVMDDGEYQYAHGFLEASTLGILAGVDRLLQALQIDPVGGSE